MPRDLVFGNGEMLVNLDNHLNIRDLYYPYVGQLNHVGGYRCRVGIWTADVGFAWIGDEWQREIRYTTDTLVSDCTARLNRLGLSIRFRHGVSPTSNVFFNRITVTNLWKADRKVRIFFAFDLRIDESDIGDTAFFHPDAHAMIHYKRDRYILASGWVGEGVTALDSKSGIAHYACGIKEFGGAEGTWRDAEDGELSGNAIAQGSVDSVIGFDLDLAHESKQRLRSWIAVATDLDSVVALHHHFLTMGLDAIQDDCESITRSWIGKEPDGLENLPERVQALYRRSLLIMRSQIDKRGAILASTDTDIMRTARAHYAYVWPRDGALAAHPLDKIGLSEVTTPFYQFCIEALTKTPMVIETPMGEARALMHKYCPDGTMGASWHPWVVEGGGSEVPIQEDGTALVVWAASQRCLRAAKTEESKEIFEKLILPGARFLASHRDPKTNLPLPSWDIWEERRGVHLYTTAATIGALKFAGELASTMGDLKNAKYFEKSAAEIQAAIEEHFWDEGEERFVRTLTISPKTGKLVKDMTVDSSMFALFAYGVFAADHPKVASTMGAIGRALWVKVGIGGLARYENDYYFRVEGAGDSKQVPGNPWIICTLWLADWMIATAKSRDELRAAIDLVEWAAVCALPTGILPEQIHPVTYQPLSVAPLTWSHAQFVTTTLKYLERWAELK